MNKRFIYILSTAIFPTVFLVFVRQKNPTDAKFAQFLNSLRPTYLWVELMHRTDFTSSLSLDDNYFRIGILIEERNEGN